MRSYKWFILFLFSALPFIAYTQNEVIYHVFQRSFYDSNGDQIGDLNGLREKLDYLQELGVTSILLLPLYDSDFYHNYFARDFEKIDAEFGTAEDFYSLVREVHRRGMKIYMDMETQYVTEDHPWFEDAYNNPSSRYSDYLIFHGPHNTEPEPMVFDLTALNGYDGIVRKVTPANLRSPEVLAYNIRLFSHWVDPNGDGDFSDGVDGFRLDHMMDDLDWRGTLTDLFAQFWTPLIDALKEINPKLVFIAEQAEWGSWGQEYLAKGHVDRVFGFHLAWAIASFDKARILRVADSTFTAVGGQQHVITFIENHDTDRFASWVHGDIDKQKVVAALTLLIGGIPSIYYGQELGMQGQGGFHKFNDSDANDIPRREAFEWYHTVDGPGMALWYKNSGPWWDQSSLKDNDGISFEEERVDPRSLWATYRKLLELRMNYSAFADGTFQAIANENVSVCAFCRDDASQHFLVAVNLSDQSQKTKIHPIEIGGGQHSIEKRYGDGSYDVNGDSVNISLPPYGLVVLENQ